MFETLTKWNFLDYYECISRVFSKIKEMLGDEMYNFIVIYGETAEWVHMQIFLIFHSLSCRSKRRDTICDTERRRSYEVLKGDVLGF